MGYYTISARNLNIKVIGNTRAWVSKDITVWSVFVYDWYHYLKEECKTYTKE